MPYVRFLEIRVIREENLDPKRIWSNQTILFRIADAFTCDPGNFLPNYAVPEIKMETVHYQILELTDPRQGARFKYAVSFEEFDHAIPIIEGIIDRQAEKDRLEIQGLKTDKDSLAVELKEAQKVISKLHQLVTDVLEEKDKIHEKLSEEKRELLLAKLSQALLDELRREMDETKTTLAMIPEWEIKIHKFWFEMRKKFKTLFVKYTDEL